MSEKATDLQDAAEPVRGQVHTLSYASSPEDASERWREAQEAYAHGAQAVAAEVYDFMGARYKAYADAIAALPACRSFGDLWQWEVEFGQATVKAYGDEAAKLGAIVLRAGNGQADEKQRPPEA